MASAQSTYLSFDLDGFVQDPESWNEETAQRIAALDGMTTLSQTQIAMLKLLRAQFLRVGGPPALSHVCRLGGQDADCLNRLFPSAREAWRIAGLPNPGDEAVSYL